MTYRQVLRIGGRGDAPGLFTRTLRSVTVDGLNRLYAAGDSEILVFDADGRLLRRWSTAKPVYSVGVAGDGTVYAGQEGHVEIFRGGRLSATWADAELLGRVSAIGFVQRDVLLADAKDRCIRRYDASGKFLHNIGKDTRMRGFLIPNGVVDFSVDAEGIVHVANPGKHRVERYSPDDKLLGHIGRFDGLDPAGFSGCCNPTNVTVTGNGWTYTTEKADPRAKVYDRDGNLIAVIASEVFDANCKNMDIAVDGRGRVYVTDTVRLAILAFEGGT